MKRLHGLFEAATVELLGYADRLDNVADSQWQLSTPCAEWDVAALSKHVAAVAFQQSEAFHRARFAVTQPPSTVTVPVDPSELADCLRRSAEHLVAAEKAQADRRWPNIPLPYAVLLVGAAVGALILEYGVHRYDLSVALSDPSPALSAVTIDTVLEFGELFLLMQARPIESDPIQFEIRAADSTMRFAWNGESWINDLLHGVRLCRITTTNAVAALLMLRRIDLDDPRIEVDDVAGISSMFFSGVAPL
jgi:uncharacterized protein (TIGR03083 family)